MLSTAHANDLDEQLKAASGKVAVSTATANELQLFKASLQATFNGASAVDWQAVGYAAHSLPDSNRVTLEELPNAQQGRGFFALHTEAKNPWLLQAPHSDSDLYTGKIVSRLFLTGAFKAAQWNSVKRDVSDMAHTPNTYWQAFTLAFAEQYPDGKIIQLHGYDQETRKTDVAENSDMIISAGHDSPPQWLQQTAACLKKTLPWRVSLYPLDVQELGGTNNVQGQLLRSLGHDGFLHIEMSKATRQALLDDNALREKFMSCL